MNSILKSVALGLASATLALGASAADGTSKAPETGCSASAYMDAPPVIKPVTADGSRYFGSDALRVSDQGGVRIQAANYTRNSADAGLERLSSRVERLGEGLAATPRVIQQAANGLIAESGGSSADQRIEPKLTTLLLAALAVVTFVARRRRFN